MNGSYIVFLGIKEKDVAVPKKNTAHVWEHPTHSFWSTMTVFLDAVFKARTNLLQM
jgi:hypothetical protein